MNPDSLYVITEVAAGFLGFAAVAAGLTQERSTIEKRLLFKFMIILCLVVIWASVMPIWFSEFWSGEELWKNTLIAGGLVSIVTWVPYILVAIRSLEISGFRVKGLGSFSFFALAAFMCLGMPITMAMLFSWPISANQQLYEMQLYFVLTVVAIFFIDLTIGDESQQKA